MNTNDSALSLYRLLDAEVLANPYPLFHRLRKEDPVHWDPFLHAWVVTRYDDVLEVLHTFSADRSPSPQHLASMGLDHLSPIAEVMVKQMLFMDAPTHTRLRGLASSAFTPARVNELKAHIQEIVDKLVDAVQDKGQMDVIADLAEPLPAIVTAEMLGVPVNDRQQLKQWSANLRRCWEFSAQSGASATDGADCGRYDVVLPRCSSRNQAASATRPDSFATYRRSGWRSPDRR